MKRLMRWLVPDRALQVRSWGDYDWLLTATWRTLQPGEILDVGIIRYRPRRLRAGRGARFRLLLVAVLLVGVAACGRAMPVQASESVLACREVIGVLEAWADHRATIAEVQATYVDAHDRAIRDLEANRRNPVALEVAEATADLRDGVAPSWAESRLRADCP